MQLRGDSARGWLVWWAVHRALAGPAREGESGCDDRTAWAMRFARGKGAAAIGTRSREEASALGTQNGSVHVLACDGAPASVAVEIQ